MASSTSEAPGGGSPPAGQWLTDRRLEAAGLIPGLPLPDRRTKKWEFTDLGGLDESAFAPAAEGDAGALDRADSHLPPVEEAHRIDQVDASALSAPGSLEGGAIVLSLADAAREHPELVRKHLGQIVPPSDPFAARNESDWAGGAFVYVPAGARLDRPVQITAVQDGSGTVLHWRTLIVVEQGGEAEVWERYLSGNEDVEGLFNTTVEMVVGEGANLRYVCHQDLSGRSWVFGSQRAVVERDGALDWVALGFGGRHGKIRMETKLAGRGSSARVTGAYASSGSQHLDFDTYQEHAAEDTTSDLAFRGVLDEKATAVWWGMIRVDKGAQRTDAFQESRNLLLSKKAHADAIPGLEIEADDVRCTHAAAIAQVDADQLFYLRSRGLGDDDAKRLVIEGFLAELVERLAEGPVRDAVAAALEERLDQMLGDAGAAQVLAA